MTRGILIVATSKSVAIASNFTVFCLKKFGNFPIEIITDHPELIIKQENILIKKCVGLDAHLIKTKCAEFSSFDETMLCDVDLFFFKDYTNVWKYLDQGDLCMCVDCHSTVESCQHITGEDKDYTLSVIPKNAVQYNTGLVLFKKSPKIINLFKRWGDEWSRFKKYDQLALARALHYMPTGIVIIPPEYNTICFKDTKVLDSFIGLHDFRFLDNFKLFNNPDRIK